MGPAVADATSTTLCISIGNGHHDHFSCSRLSFIMGRTLCAATWSVRLLMILLKRRDSSRLPISSRAKDRLCTRDMLESLVLHRHRREWCVVLLGPAKLKSLGTGQPRMAPFSWS